VASSDFTGTRLAIQPTCTSCRRHLLADYVIPRGFLGGRGGRDAGHELTEFAPGLVENLGGAGHHQRQHGDGRRIVGAPKCVDDPDLPQCGGRLADGILDLPECSTASGVTRRTDTATPLSLLHASAAAPETLVSSRSGVATA
jgi:hypothetical protein